MQDGQWMLNGWGRWMENGDRGEMEYWKGGKGWLAGWLAGWNTEQERSALIEAAVQQHLEGQNSLSLAYEVEAHRYPFQPVFVPRSAASIPLQLGFQQKRRYLPGSLLWQKWSELIRLLVSYSTQFISRKCKRVGGGTVIICRLKRTRTKSRSYFLDWFLFRIWVKWANTWHFCSRFPILFEFSSIPNRACMAPNPFITVYLPKLHRWKWGHAYNTPIRIPRTNFLKLAQDTLWKAFHILLYVAFI